MNMKRFTHKQFEDVKFDDIPTVNVDGKRHYKTPTGSKLPSVTTVVGWEKSKFFAEWRRKNPEESKRVTVRGNKLHSLIEKYLLNEFDPDTDYVPLNIMDLFLQLKPELDKIDNVYALEVPLWSDMVGLAGRVDCVAEHDGTLSIIDFKGSTREKKSSDIENYYLQATAYALMWQEMTGIAIDTFKILVACEQTCTCQVFEGNPINYVKRLKEVIDSYNSLIHT
tara:strand:+ start:374 stop:1045 length:672 start_codon:yes stop_codon:yes gene_type:complete